jgi:type II secretory pathway component PulC
MKSILILAIAMIMFTGCVQSGYSQFYTQAMPKEAFQKGIDEKYIIPLKDDEEPQIYQSNNIEEDSTKVISNGYIPFSYSSFNGPFENIENAKKQAKEVGAHIVMVKNDYTDTANVSGAFVMPDNRTTYSSGNINMNTNYNNNRYGYTGNSNTYGNYYGSSTTYGTQVVPYATSVRRYNQEAVYYVKVDISKYPLGTIKNEEITREERIKIGTNGIKVKYILNNSPAYNSDLLRGDIIVKIDGEEIKNITQFTELTKKYINYKGKSILTVHRDGNFKEIGVNF